MTGYDPATYWSDVARRARERGQGKDVAGDDSPYYRYKRHLFLKRFLSTIPVEGQRVLEVGCGPGGNLRELALRKPSRLVGCDVAPGMVELARDAIDHLGAEVLLTDGSSLPFSDLEFDLSLTVTVLMHNSANRVAKLASELARVTTSSIFIIEDTVTTQTSDEFGVGEYGQVYPRTTSAFADFLLPHGFELVRAERLRTRASQRANRLLLRLFERDGHKEGEPYSRVHWFAGQLALPFTRVIDRLMASPEDELTMMHFTRRQRPRG